MATWRVHVKAPDAAKMDEFKNDKRFYKLLYNHGGAEATFELPESNEKGADDVVAAAKAAGFEAKKEKYEDPLDSVEGGADFW
jgi:hypothetical protein